MSSYEPGSFRDPGSAVFTVGGRVLRGLSGPAAADYHRLTGTSFFPRQMASGQVVGTTDYEGEAPASPRGAPWARVLEHERVPVVSYPYEWPFAMLREAAALHLEVLAAALDDNMSFGGRVVVEFVEVDDVQVRRLLANKPAGLFDDYRREAFERLLAEQFLVHEQQRLPNGSRTLYLAEPTP